jgi:hypothetical protein
VSTSPLHIIGHGGSDAARPSILLLQDPAGPGLRPRANSPGLRFFARWFGYALDRQLASGLAPESKSLLAARAERLVSPSMRMALAQNWRDLLQRAARPPVVTRPYQVPLCRDRIVGAEGDVRAMLLALTAPRPISARGVARASWLLSDGAGPLYDRHSKIDLRRALQAATSELESWGDTI